MYLVRNVFIAKPGSAGKMAKLMKETAGPLKNARVMLDFATDFNKIILEHEVESLAEFEKIIEEFKSKPDPKMKGYTDLYLTGKREIYLIVD